MGIKETQTWPSARHDIETVQQTIETTRNVRLTSSELANLWSSWMESSIKEQFVKYFLKTTEDQEIIQILNYTLDIAKKHLKLMTEIYTRENHALLVGFTDEDVNLEAPRLFSDSAILSFIEELAKTRLDGYPSALMTSSRTDIRKYFTECVNDAAEIYNRSVSALLSKGMYVRPPYIPVPKTVEFAKDKSYLAGYLGKRKPLNCIEISHLFAYLHRNSIRVALFKAFSQVTNAEDVRKYMEKGKALSAKHIEIFSSILKQNDLPVSMPWEEGITDSKIAPFSEKIMLQQIRSSTTLLIVNYGKTVTLARHDLSAELMKLMSELLIYLNEGLKLLIDKGLYEEPPQIENQLH